MRQFARCLVSILVVTLYSTVAWGADSSINTINIMPSIDGSPYLVIDSAKTLDKREFHAGFFLDYANTPLECTGAGCAVNNVIDYMVLGHYNAALGIRDWVEVGFAMPVVFYNRFFNATTGVEMADGSMGDLYLQSKFRLLNGEKHRFGIAVLPYVTLPTGDSTQFLGSGTITGGLKAIGEVKLGKRVHIALNLGYEGRDNITQNGVRMDDKVMYGMGLTADVLSQLSLFTTVSGYGVVGDLWDRTEQSPLEAQVGARYDIGHGLTATAASGFGLVDGVGTPNYRVIGGLEFAAKAKPTIAKAKPTAVIVEDHIITDKIYFDFDKATIKSESLPALDAVATLLSAHPTITLVSIEGHTDNIGTDAYNQTLSQARAQAVLDYLVQNGIASERLTSVGYGESKPVDTNTTRDGRALNRRTEFLIVK